MFTVYTTTESRHYRLNITSIRKKGCYTIPFRQSDIGATSCEYVFRIQSLPGRSQLLLWGTLTLSHHTSNSHFPGPSTTTHKVYAVPPCLGSWDKTKATKELSEMLVATPYSRGPLFEEIKQGSLLFILFHESCPW